MRIKVLGAGFYGLHLGLALVNDGHEVEIHEIADRVLAGASGNCPARLHLGALHYPRSGATQAACGLHQSEFLDRYGFLTRHVPTNIYAVAAYDSLVDFHAYRRVLRDRSIQFIDIRDPSEYGLANIEGAVLTGERHIVADLAATYFTEQLGKRIKLNAEPDTQKWDVTIDATFAALDAEGIDRYEPCMTVMLEGPTDRATTVVDGPFCGVYPWDEAQHLSSLTSASLTPLSKTCRTYAEAKAVLSEFSATESFDRAEQMLDQMSIFWPEVRDLYRIVDCRRAIRAMPRSGADSRLVDVRSVQPGLIRVRAGKIDAVIEADRQVDALLPPYCRVAPL